MTCTKGAFVEHRSTREWASESYSYSNPHGRSSTLYELSAWSFCLRVFGGATPNSSLEVKAGRIIINCSYSLYVALGTWRGFTVAIPSTAQGPTHVLVQQLQTCWLHFLPHTHHGSSHLCTLLVTGCHISLWRVNHLRLNTPSFESQVIIRQDNTIHHLYQHMLMPQSTHLRRPLRKNYHQSGALNKNRTSFHLGTVIFVHHAACHKEKITLSSKSLFLWDQTAD